MGGSPTEECRLRNKGKEKYSTGCSDRLSVSRYLFKTIINLIIES